MCALRGTWSSSTTLAFLRSHQPNHFSGYIQGFLRFVSDFPQNSKCLLKQFRWSLKLFVIPKEFHRVPHLSTLHFLYPDFSITFCGAGVTFTISWDVWTVCTLGALAVCATQRNPAPVGGTHFMTQPDLWALSSSQQDMPGTHMLNQVFFVLWRKSPSVPEATLSCWPHFDAGWRWTASIFSLNSITTIIAGWI